MALTRRLFMGGLASWALPSIAMPTLMLARDAKLDIDPAGYLVSEKFDGVRAVWDGRTLRFRSGLPVNAPDWFLARLPGQRLDGELWLERGQFEVLSGIVRKAVPVDAEWRTLRYQLFDLPGAAGNFAARAKQIQSVARLAAWQQLLAIPQAAMADQAALRRRLDDVLRAGGEGLMLHRADALWNPGRSTALLKLKPMQDAEAVVVGHVAGRGKHAGRLGALQVRTPQGQEFLIGTGFSDEQREAPPPEGSSVTYRFRGLTATGLPRHASFLRAYQGI